MSDLIAIVGRPNVGKSALFNRIVGKRIAIVHDEPGVTRDRISAEAEWCGRPFMLVDTGGIGLARGEKAHDAIVDATLDQVQLAIDSAQVIILVVNVCEGPVPLDHEAAGRLRQSGKTVLVAANKADHDGIAAAAVEFAELGFEKIFPVSAIHGLGIGPLLDAALVALPAPAAGPGVPTESSAAEAGAADSSLAEPLSGPLKLAILGRPNVGKSSIINTLTHSHRVIVSPIPGTTRDAVDVPFEVETDGVRQKYILIDTAGVRKARRIDDSVEFYSVKRTEDSIGRCDIAILVLDAIEGILEQDKKIADKILEKRKACIVVVNKWDLVAEQLAEPHSVKILRQRKAPPRRGGAIPPLLTLAEFGGWVQKQLFFLDYSPVIFTSATTGFHLDRLLEAVRYVAAQLQQRIPTAILNRTLQDSVERKQPVSASGHHLKFFYATQVRQAPPTFLLFVNRGELFSDPYKRYLAGEIRRAFGYEGCPIVLVPKARPKTVEPVRKYRSKPPRKTR